MVFDYVMLNQTKEVHKSYTYLGFPRTENYSNQLKANKVYYKTYVRENMIDFNDPNVPQEIKDSSEFVLDLTNPETTTLNLKVKPNATRAEEQKKLREKIIKKEKKDGTYENRFDKNVMILYFDNLSRAHFYRKLPKTAQWFSKFTSNEKELTTTQYFRYHSVYYNTLWSNNAMYYGEIKNLKNTSQNVFDSYSENGYITGFFKDA